MYMITGECMDISLKGEFCRNPSTNECINLDKTINCRDKLTNNCKLVSNQICLDTF